MEDFARFTRGRHALFPQLGSGMSSARPPTPSPGHYSHPCTRWPEETEGRWLSPRPHPSSSSAELLLHRHTHVPTRTTRSPQPLGDGGWGGVWETGACLPDLDLMPLQAMLCPSGNQQPKSQDVSRERPAHPPLLRGWAAPTLPPSPGQPTLLLSPWNSLLGPDVPSTLPGLGLREQGEPTPGASSLCRGLPALSPTSCPAGIWVSTSLLAPFSGSGRKWEGVEEVLQGGLLACNCGGRGRRRRGRGTAMGLSAEKTQPCSPGARDEGHRLGREGVGRGGSSGKPGTLPVMAACRPVRAP